MNGKIGDATVVRFSCDGRDPLRGFAAHDFGRRLETRRFA